MLATLIVMTIPSCAKAVFTFLRVGGVPRAFFQIGEFAMKPTPRRRSAGNAKCLTPAVTHCRLKWQLGI